MSVIPLEFQPLSQALEYGGTDKENTWGRYKQLIRFGRMMATCLVDGQRIRLKPDWLDHIMLFGADIDPLPELQPTPGTSIKRDKRRPCDVPSTDFPKDDALWFCRAPGSPLGMPGVITAIEIDISSLRLNIMSNAEGNGSEAPSSPQSAPKASKEAIRSVVRSIYIEAAQSDEKAPNSKEIKNLAYARIMKAGRVTTKTAISEIADEPEFRNLRLRPGQHFKKNR